ncbi:hypothetical cytosolic protein [Trichinella spiralis]|uniref:hypothetical cytosolic protein n=1 Tax=Trichinella spiralis TaxID=6334 RepID=UPI0001EFDEB1|nr:hypothetical cytosolic protein [Trichinella spiralis]
MFIGTTVDFFIHIYGSEFSTISHTMICLIAIAAQDVNKNFVFLFFVVLSKVWHKICHMVKSRCFLMLLIILYCAFNILVLAVLVVFSTRSHNVVRESFAVTKDVSGIQVPADLSKPLITVEMVNIIVRKTNEKTVQLHQKSVKNIQMLCGIGKK